MYFKRALMVLCFVLMATSTAYSAPKGFIFNSVEVGGREFKYTVFVPRNYDSRQNWPLIVFLHGAGECGVDGFKQVTVGLGGAIMANMDKWPFVVIMAQKPSVDEQWEVHDDAVMAMLKTTERAYKIDKKRVYLTGLSQGGHGTWVIGGKHPDIWAAIAPVCGYGDAKAIAPPLKDMPIWAFHGEADSVVSVSESINIVNAIKAEGGTPKLTTYPGVDHNSWDNAYRKESLFDWFLSHTKGEKK